MKLKELKKLQLNLEVIQKLLDLQEPDVVTALYLKKFMSKINLVNVYNLIHSGIEDNPPNLMVYLIPFKELLKQFTQKKVKKKFKKT